MSDFDLAFDMENPLFLRLSLHGLNLPLAPGTWALKIPLIYCRNQKEGYILADRLP